VLCLLGGKGAAGLPSSVITRYRSTFDSIDQDGDGYATREEYVERGRYMNKQSRAGIFRASDRNGDQVVSEKEYVENRIITDEAKDIFEGLKLDDNNTVDRNELAKALVQSDDVNVDAIFRQFDTNGDEQWQMIEFLRVWGDLARRDSHWTDYSKAKRKWAVQ
jgi:Ca2+-binding EF-hand superfamily protein